MSNDIILILYLYYLITSKTDKVIQSVQFFIRKPKLPKIFAPDYNHVGKIKKFCRLLSAKVLI